MKNYLTIEQSDGSTWGIPVAVIVEHKAKSIAVVYDISIDEATERVKKEFEADQWLITKWASIRMVWSMVESSCVKLSDPADIDLSEGWIHGRKGLA